MDQRFFKKHWSINTMIKELWGLKDGLPEYP